MNDDDALKVSNLAFDPVNLSPQPSGERFLSVKEVEERSREYLNNTFELESCIPVDEFIAGPKRSGRPILTESITGIRTRTGNNGKLRILDHHS